MGKVARGKWSSDGVIVTVYEETPVLAGSHSGNQKIRIRNSKPRMPSGYDRRAELLAYAHQLRNAGSQQLDRDQSCENSIPKPKKRRRWLAPLRKLRRLFAQTFGRKKTPWCYESIDAQESKRKYRLSRPRRSRWSN